MIDPRRTFAISERFHGLRVVDDWPDIALSDTDLDNEATLVALALNPKFNATALHKLLGKSLFHIACLGSRSAHVERPKCLPKAGFSEAETAKIKGPAGLFVGAKIPAEIAVPVMGKFFVAYICRALR